MSGIILTGISHLVTCNDSDERWSDVDLAIEDGRILAIGPELDRRYPQWDRLDCRGCFVGPGLVNTHHHFYQAMFRGIPEVQGMELFDWLKTLYRYWEHLDEEIVYYGSQVALTELLKTGCTLASDHHYVFPRGAGGHLIDVQIGVARDLGIRFHPTRGSMSLSVEDGGLPPASVVQTDGEILEDSVRLIETWHDPSPGAMTRIALSPCSPFSVTLDLMRETARLARDRGVMLHTHVAETLDEQEYCIQTHGMRPIDLMESLEWMGEDVWYAHAVHLNDEEVDRMVRTGTGIAHCPSSNMKLGSGICRCAEIWNKGGNISVAVDGSASNDGSNLWQEMKRAYYLSHLKDGPGGLSADQTYKMASRGGARVLGRTDTGVLAPGMQADLIVVDLDVPAFAGCHDPLVAVVNCGSSDLVKHVFVAGRQVVCDGKIPGVDDRELYRKAHQAARDCVRRNR